MFNNSIVRRPCQNLLLVKLDILLKTRLHVYIAKKKTATLVDLSDTRLVLVFRYHLLALAVITKLCRAKFT